MVKQKGVVKRSSNSKRKLVKGIFVVVLLGLIVAGIVYYSYFGKDVRMSSTTEIFKVIDDETNAPISGAIIMIKPTAPSTPLQYVADANGEVSITVDFNNLRGAMTISDPKLDYVPVSWSGSNDVNLLTFINFLYDIDGKNIIRLKKADKVKIWGLVRYKDCPNLGTGPALYVPNHPALVFVFASYYYGNEEVKVPFGNFFTVSSSDTGLYTFDVPKTTTSYTFDGTSVIENNLKLLLYEVRPKNAYLPAVEHLPWPDPQLQDVLYYAFKGDPKGLANTVIINQKKCSVTGPAAPDPVCKQCKGTFFPSSN